MPWKEVCVRGPAGGKVRQDDVNRSDPPLQHTAGGPFPLILLFIDEVIRLPPRGNFPEAQRFSQRQLPHPNLAGPARFGRAR